MLTFVLGVITGIYIAQNFNVPLIKPYFKRFYDIIIQYEDIDLQDENYRTYYNEYEEVSEEENDESNESEEEFSKEIVILENNKTNVSVINRYKNHFTIKKE